MTPADVRTRPPQRRFLPLNHAYAVQADLDWLAWVFGLTAAALLRVDFDTSKLEWWGQAAILPIALLFQLIAGGVTGLYSGRWQRGSFEEIAAVARAVALCAVGLLVVDLVAGSPRMVPLSSIIAGGALALICMLGSRYLARVRSEKRSRPGGVEVERVVVVGAGEAGHQVVSSMLREPSGRYLPIAIVDDDPMKQNLRLRGVPVVGTISDVATAAANHGAQTVLIAIPTADRELIARATTAANSGGLTVKILPTVGALIDGTVGVGDIRDLEPADLLGRAPIDTDVAAIAAYLEGKRVLVTGAGGSIGSELCRQINRFRPAQLVMLDRDESALHAVELSIRGQALLDTPDTALCDIRDRAAVEAVFRTARPDVVFHAAALKHLPMLERYPDEGFKTNVLGSLHVLEVAAANNVERLVNISTDKAADPTSVLGYTKRMAERLTASVGAAAPGEFMSVRFGNVLGSRGSMLETFTRQIRAGGPVTVTDPDVARFFMTIAEACELVIQAGAIGRTGEVLVLDMGRPVRIIDVARQLITQSGREVPLVITGLRPGEKLHEVLLAEDETIVRQVHPAIAHVSVEPFDDRDVGELRQTGSFGPGKPAQLWERMRSGSKSSR